MQTHSTLFPLAFLPSSQLASAQSTCLSITRNSAHCAATPHQRLLPFSLVIVFSNFFCNLYKPLSVLLNNQTSSSLALRLSARVPVSPPFSYSPPFYSLTRNDIKSLADPHWGLSVTFAWGSRKVRRRKIIIGRGWGDYRDVRRLRTDEKGEVKEEVKEE
jgi:hypothetical protein